MSNNSKSGTSIEYGISPSKNEIDSKNSSTSSIVPFQSKNFFLTLNDGKIVNIPIAEDGYVDVTELTKFAGKQIGHWHATKEAKSLIHACSVTLNKRIVDVYRIKRLGRTQHSFAHPFLVVPIAQWCSPEYAMKVSQIMLQYHLTGRVESGQEMSVQELEQSWNEKMKKLTRENTSLLEENNQLIDENKSLAQEKRKLTSDMIKLSTKCEKFKLKRRHPQLDKGHCFYIHHNNEVGNENRYKMGSSENINKTIAEARRVAPYTIIEFIMYLSDRTYKLVENGMKQRFLKQRKPLTHELVNASLYELTSAAMDVCKVMNIEYKLANRSRLDAYNEFILADTSSDEKKSSSTGTEGYKCDTETEQVIQISNIDGGNTVNIENITNITINVPNTDVNELKSLDGKLENFPVAMIDFYLKKYDLAKYGNKAKKIDRLQTYISRNV